MGLLLRSAEPLCSSELASRLGVTPRSVRYSLPAIERWLRAKGLDLLRRPGVGLWVETTKQNKAALLRELDYLTPCPLVLSADQRVHSIVLSLLAADQPVLIKQLELELNVSRTTILADLEAVTAWLTGRGLDLVKKPNFGIRVEGPESQVRGAIVALLVEVMGVGRLLSALSSGAHRSKAAGAQDWAQVRIVESFLDSLEWNYSGKQVARIESEMNVHFADDARVDLALYLAILIKRVREGRGVDCCSVPLEQLHMMPEYAISASVAGRISRCFCVPLSQWEVEHIAKHLVMAQTMRRTERPDLVSTESIMEARRIAESIMTRASVYLHPCLRVDQELCDNLASHLEWALAQLRLGLPIWNPLLPQVKEEYAYVFGIARASTRVLSESIGTVPEEEIGYIALHLVAAMERLRQATGRRLRILVVCNSAAVTAWLLLSRLRAEFPEVDIVGVTSAFELQRRDCRGDVDMIISTIPINSKAIPSVVVSPLITPGELSKLRSTLVEQTNQIAPPFGMQQGGSSVPSLADLLTPEMILVKAKANSWQEVVYAAGKLLLDRAAVEPRYVQAMRDIIVQLGPYMVAWPGVALLHARPQDGARRICMSLITLETPVNFGCGENDPVDTAIAISAVDQQSHLTALATLCDMLQDEDALHRIRCATRTEEVAQVAFAYTQKVANRHAQASETRQIAGNS